MSSESSSLRSMLRWRGDLVERGEDLERHVAVDQARHVDVAAVAANEQVAAPQQRVGVEVGDVSVSCSARARADGRVRRDERVVGLSRRSVRATSRRPAARLPA